MTSSKQNNILRTDNLVVSDSTQDAMRRRMYERIAEGQAIITVEETARRKMDKH